MKPRKYKPHKYQNHMTDAITQAYYRRDNGIGLFLDMGLGKTIITLSAVDAIIRKNGTIPAPVLVIGTLRVINSVWGEEIQKWEHLSYMEYINMTGPPSSREKALRTPGHVFGINRENVPWLVNYCMGNGGWPFEIVIIDEMTSFKSHSSVRFKAVKKVLNQTRMVIGLTGTPDPNGLMDLWSEVYLLDRGRRLGKNITEYRNRYFYPAVCSGRVVYRWAPTAGSKDAIFNRISDICVSLKAGDWLDTPEASYLYWWADMPPNARKVYSRLKKDMVSELGNGVTIAANGAAALVGKLLQVSNGAVYDETHAYHELHDAKIDALAEILEEANGSPVLVFYNYKHDKERILKRMGEECVLIEEKDSIQRWNNGDIKLMLAHPASAGHGINLQYGGHIVAWFGVTWDLELYQQANARVLRQGQTKPVMIYHIVSHGSLDGQVVKMLNTKDISQQELINSVLADIIDDE